MCSIILRLLSLSISSLLLWFVGSPHLKISATAQTDNIPSLRKLGESYGDGAMKRSQVYDWHNRFRDGRSDVCENVGRVLWCSESLPLPILLVGLILNKEICVDGSCAYRWNVGNIATRYKDHRAVSRITVNHHQNPKFGLKAVSICWKNRIIGHRWNHTLSKSVGHKSMKLRRPALKWLMWWRRV